ncbi:cell division protein SepF [Nonomuraea sp. RK-328]|uniref:Cell division protein SepF n=3 Tax=Nonomuraea TaxID=83681 RepID=A0A7Y6M7T2_9ACTN|nr:MULTISPECIES: cell division protein SepF [Nonomuraea]MBN6056224.1 cell division protein SepF [Nonomuraea sp. RK-328]MCP2347975.1 cell division inhibitor SepF [Nonomuraea roseoviolacea subsp. carminata]NUW38373.1 cell division protein SepF [Nonomuraea montanisoli]NUW47027.1 cell division protein SepF [Nonomuraea rhodomycinica]
MGAVRKVVNYLGLGGVDQYDDHYDDEQYEEEYMPASERAARRWRSTVDPSRIVMVQPLKYNDAPMIGQHFRDGQTVIMDVTGMPMPEATRMVDFAAGLAYGCEGRIERIADRVFLLAPAHVEIETS